MRSLKFFFNMHLFFFVCCLIVNPAIAQITDNTSQLLRDLSEEQKQPTDPEFLPEVPIQGISDQPNANRFLGVLVQVEIEGSQFFSESESRKITEDYMGQRVSEAELGKIIAQFMALYRNQGYFLTAIKPHIRYLPAQEADQDQQITLELRVIEGFIDQIILEPIEGMVLFHPDQQRILAYSHPILASKPLHIDVMERALLLIRDMPGITVKSVIRPSKTVQGAANLHLLIEHQDLSFSTHFQNRGSDNIGPYRGQIQGKIRSWSGRSEETALSIAGLIPTGETQGRLRYLSVQHQELLGNQGLSLKGHVSYMDNQEGGALSRLDLKGRAFSANLAVKYPFQRSRRQNIYGEVILDHLTQTTDLLDEQIVKDKLWSMRLKATFEQIGAGYVTRLKAAVSKGLPIFGASLSDDDQLSRLRGKGDYLKFTAEAKHDQLLGAGLIASLTFRGQYSGTRLLSSEEFSLGGNSFARAYQSGSAIGDLGVAAGLEIKKSFQTGFGLQFQPYSYIDAGQVWNYDQVDNQHLISTGLGMRVSHKWGGWADISLNMPLVDKDLDQYAHAPRLYVSGGFQF